MKQLIPCKRLEELTKALIIKYPEDDIDTILRRDIQVTHHCKCNIDNVWECIGCGWQPEWQFRT